MDDLARRLRSLAVINPQIPGNNAGCRVCTEAADEIERLRAQLTEWQDDYAALKKARATDLNDALSHLRAGIDKLRHTPVEIPIELYKACHALTHIVAAITDEHGTLRCQRCGSSNDVFMLCAGCQAPVTSA